MPASQQMLEDLDRAGYRPITISSYNDLIGGCRYVSIETDGKITQFTPTDTRSSWSIWEWDSIGARYISGNSRSGLGFHPLKSGEWFGSVPERVSAVLYPGKVSYMPVAMPFSAFISNCIGGQENPFGIAGAFNQRHPIDTVERAKSDLRRVQAELDAREASVRHEEAFREVSALRLAASECERAGDTTASQVLRARSEAMRREVQARLDTEAQAYKNNYRPERSILEPAAETQTFEWRGFLNREREQTDRRREQAERASRGARAELDVLRTQIRTPEPKITKLEIAQPNNKRSFLSDDEV